MAAVTFDIPDEEYRQLADLLGEDGVHRLGKAAFAEWANWLLAKLRPRSVTDIETMRVMTLYSEVFTTQFPSAAHIGSVFQLPLGRCRYVIQALNYQYPNLIRKRTLESALQLCNAARRVDADFVVDVNVEHKALMDQILSKLYDGGEINSEVKGTRIANKVRYNMGEGHYNAVLGALRRELQTI